MCGFLCEFVYQEQHVTPRADFEALLALSKHRGPDATQVISTSSYQLGFNRLAVLDLSPNGNQPILSPSQRYHLVFNGEIYNYKALAATYDLKDLRSTSDTEVIVQLLDVLGVVATVKLLNGMFAMAIVDTQEAILYLTRDFAGVKPLFYGVSKQGLVAASQFNQVYKHPFFEPHLNLRKAIVKEYFGLGYMQAPNTIYEHIFQVSPGELVSITKTGVITKASMQHYQSRPDLDIQTITETHINEFNSLLESVVKKQLVSDVPLATFLSGGIDSPLVTALAHKSVPAIETFTVGLEDNRYDESKQAWEYGQHLGVSQHIESIGVDTLLGSINDHFKKLSEPFGDYSSIPTYVITKMARKKHTVMLSGDGGDELFFGYPRHLDVVQRCWIFKLPFAIRKLLTRLGIKLGWWQSWAPYHYKTMADWVMAKHLHVSKKELDRLIPHVSFSEELQLLYKLPQKTSKHHLLHWLRWNEFYAHLQRVLIKVDRMSMANSLEVRVPFLDKASIDFAWKLRPKFFKSRFELKGLLKSVLGLHYPKAIINLKKQGFSVPMHDWLLHALKVDVEAAVFETPFYGAPDLDADAFRSYVRGFYEGKHREFWGVWHVYAWQKWALAEGLVG